MEKRGYAINDIYQGGYSSLSPSYGDIFTGYRVAAGSLGLTTDPRTANVLQEVSSKLSTGLKQIELSAVSPEILESIPKDQFKEINRLSKLIGIDVSVHAPVVEPSGITREGFTESNREAIERQMTFAVERSHEIDPKGNVPVTFHSSAIIPQAITTKGKKPEETFIINSETGSTHKLPLKKREFPGEEKEPNIKKELAKINESQWSEGIRSLSYYADIGERSIKEAGFISKTAEAEKAAGKPLVDAEKQAISSFNTGATFLNDSYRQLRELFETANKYGRPEDQKILNQFSKTIEADAIKIQENPKSQENVHLMQEIIEKGVEAFNNIKTPPQIYQELNEFAKEKTTETFSNVAWNAYKKVKKGDWKQAPIISIENPPVGGAFSTGEELKEIVEKSREKFVEKAVKEGISESLAKEQADKLIGVTWDLGHINMLRKYGYESKDIVKETEKVAKFVKHIHLSDNFGFEHTELPMGMGNVPTKEIMEKLGKEGFEAKKIIEAASWWQHFKTPPVQETLQAFGSPIYTEQGPYWNQVLGLQQGYNSGFGPMLPSGNYETFGAGFAQLPTELGGQKPGGAGDRMSGKPME